MVSYDKIASEVNKICDTDCWKNPKKECPYYCVCEMRLNGNGEERTEEFEAAMIALYKELNEFDIKNGDMFSTGYGIYKIVEIKDDIIYAIRKGDTYNSLEDFNVLEFTRHEVENYVKY